MIPPRRYPTGQDQIGVDLGYLNVKDFGATGNGTTDDTAAINACMSAARLPGGKRGAVVRFPAGVYQVSSPIQLYDNVHVIGASSYFSPTYYNASILRATGGFSGGSAIMVQNPDGNTVSDPTTRDDESYHFGLIDRMCFYGNGTSGPHGLDPGWNGEATTIRNCSFTLCNSGIYLNDTQASATIEHCSMFNNTYGLNCDNVQGVVRVFGISGDNNVSLIRAKGGRSAAITVIGVKAENYDVGTGDPVIDIVDLAGGSFTLIGGWADTSSARTRVIRISQPGASSNRPRVFIAGFDCNSLYTNLLQDTFDSHTIPSGSVYPHIIYNSEALLRGSTELNIGYARSITALQSDEATPMYLASAGSDNSTYYYAGPGTNGGRITDSSGSNMTIQWRTGGANNIGFLGATPVTRQTVTGSRGGNAALASLLTGLANLGLITDSSS